MSRAEQHFSIIGSESERLNYPARRDIRVANELGFISPILSSEVSWVSSTPILT
ncbi:MAG: hypothetical protein WAU42_03645 [Solirubrobacteraceae bacterium]